MPAWYKFNADCIAHKTSSYLFCIPLLLKLLPTNEAVLVAVVVAATATDYDGDDDDNYVDDIQIKLKVA